MGRSRHPGNPEPENRAHYAQDTCVFPRDGILQDFFAISEGLLNRTLILIRVRVERAWMRLGQPFAAHSMASSNRAQWPRVKPGNSGMTANERKGDADCGPSGT